MYLARELKTQLNTSLTTTTTNIQITKSHSVRITNNVISSSLKKECEWLRVGYVAGKFDLNVMHTNTALDRNPTKMSPTM
jgi:hypothetical protein